MVFATVLTLVSGWDYLRGALPLLRGEPGVNAARRGGRGRHRRRRHRAPECCATSPCAACERSLVERGDFASGTSGRYHGLLHSGARYVESDPISARHCIEENARPASHRAGNHRADRRLLRRHARTTRTTTSSASRPRARPPASRRSRCALDELFARRAAPQPRGSAPRTACRTPRSSRGSSSTRTSPARGSTAPRRGATRPSSASSARPMERVTRGPHCATSAAARRRTIACRAVVSAAGAWAGKVAALAGAHAGNEPGQGLDAHPQPAHDVGGRQPAGAAGRRRHPRSGAHRLHPRHDRHHGPDPDDVEVTRDEVDALLARWRAPRPRHQRRPGAARLRRRRARCTTPPSLRRRRITTSRARSAARTTSSTTARATGSAASGASSAAS